MIQPNRRRRRPARLGWSASGSRFRPSNGISDIQLDSPCLASTFGFSASPWRSVRPLAILATTQAERSTANISKSSSTRFILEFHSYLSRAWMFLVPFQIGLSKFLSGWTTVFLVWLELIPFGFRSFVLFFFLDSHVIRSNDISSKAATRTDIPSCGWKRRPIVLWRLCRRNLGDFGQSDEFHVSPQVTSPKIDWWHRLTLHTGTLSSKCPSSR